MIMQINSYSLSALWKSYAGQRLITAAFIFSCSLLAAWVLGPALYGQIFLMMFLAKLLLLGNFGSVSGYMHHFYTSENKISSTEDFILSYGVHLLFVSIAAIVVGSLFGDLYFFGALSFALLLPFFLVEPVLRVKRKFYISLFPDLMLNCSLLVGLFYYYLYGEEKEAWGGFINVYLCFLAAGGLVFTFCACRRYGVRRLVLARPRFEYINILRVGFPVFVGTAAFSLFLCIDRFFLERYHSAESLGTYMLGFQLAMGATLIVSSLNFTAGVDYGDLIKQKKSLEMFVVRRLREALFLSFASMFFLVLGSFILQKYFFREYHGLAVVSFSLGAGLCGFYTAGSITPVVLYLNKQVFLMCVMFGVVMLSVLGNIYFVVSGRDYVWCSVYSGLLLLFYSFVSVRYVLSLRLPCASHCE